MSTNPLAEKYVGQYLGPNKIVGIEVIEMKTPSGGSIFEVETRSVSENNVEFFEKELVPERAVAVTISEQSRDYTKTFEAKMNALVPQIVDLLEEYNVDYSQIDTMIKSIEMQADMRFNRALSFLFTKNDKNFIPGFDPRNSISLLMAERVINSIPKEDAPTEK